MDDKTGIYVAYPTSQTLKVTYKNAKTKVNDQHTNVGSTSDSFKSRRKGYQETFHKEVEFFPVVFLDKELVDRAHNLILDALHQHFKKVGQSDTWFETPDHQNVLAIIIKTMEGSDIKHKIERFP